MKKKLTRDEEFQIMKLVLDKFVWAGLIIMLLGLHTIISQTGFVVGLWIMVGGAGMLLLLMTLILKEFEVAQ